jgi:hypothetical protein
MATFQGTVRLQTTGRYWRARLACALVITVMVGILTYVATYKALVVISTPGTTSTAPGPSPTATPSTATPVSPPAH